jgi:hypothetical protein
MQAAKARARIATFIFVDALEKEGEKKRRKEKLFALLFDC